MGNAEGAKAGADAARQKRQAAASGRKRPRRLPSEIVRLHPRAGALERFHRECAERSRFLRDEALVAESHTAAAQHQKAYARSMEAYHAARQHREDAEEAKANGGDIEERIAMTLARLPAARAARIIARAKEIRDGR